MTLYFILNSARYSIIDPDFAQFILCYIFLAFVDLDEDCFSESCTNVFCSVLFLRDKTFVELLLIQ